MALTCPNKNHPDWKALVKKTGSELEAYKEYIKNGFDIPVQDAESDMLTVTEDLVESGVIKPGVAELGLNIQNQEQLEFHINTLNVILQFLENIGIETRLVPEFLSQDGSVVEGAVAAANFIEGTVDIIDDLNKRIAEAWNKLPEEAAHWWYRLLRENSPLKKALLESHQTALKSDELYKGQYGKLASKPEDLTEETIGQLIAEAIKRIETKNANAADYSFFKKFLEWINSIIDIFKDTAHDPFEVAAMKILSSDMSDLMTWEEYRKLNNIVNFADVLTEQSVAPIDYTLIEDLVELHQFNDEFNGEGYYVTFPINSPYKNYKGFTSSETFKTKEELDNWVSANIKEHDIRQKQLAIEVRDNQIFFDRLLNKTFRKKSKFLPKTLRKYYDIVDAQNLNPLRKWDISQELQQITKKLSEQEKRQIIETNGYTNIAPTLKVLPDLLQKYRKNPIVLSESIKIDSAKKQELSILNGIREMIKLENPNLKSITAEEFVNEAHNWLAVNYGLGFAEFTDHATYRQGNSAFNLINSDVYNNDIALYFNDTAHQFYGQSYIHFKRNFGHPSAFGSLAYFRQNGSSEKNAVLLHQTQNDNIEALREFKAKKVDLETSLGRYLQQLNTDLLDNITQIESGGKKIIKKDFIDVKKGYIQLNYQLRQLKDLPLEQGLQQLKERLNERIELFKSDRSKDIDKAQKFVDKAYSKRRKFVEFQKRGGIKSLLTKGELGVLKEILHSLNTEYEPGFLAVRDLNEKKQEFRELVASIVIKINDKLKELYGSDVPYITLQAPAKPLSKSQRNMRTVGHGQNQRRIGGASRQLNESVNFLIVYSERKIYEYLSKEIERSKKNYIHARNATIANDFNVALSKITPEQYATLIENYKYNEDLLNRLIDEQTQKDVKQSSNLQAQKENDLKRIKENHLGFWGIPNEYNNNDTLLQFNTKEEAEKYYNDKYDVNIQKNKQQQKFEALKQKALDKKEELEKNYGKIEEEVKQAIEIELNYFTPLVHHLIQKHINQYGKDSPMYFSGYQITKLTQGNDRTALIYAGKDEIDIVPHYDITINGKSYRHDGKMKYVPLAFYIDDKQYRNINGEYSTREYGLIENITEQEYNKAKQEYEKAYQQATERRAKEIKFEAAKHIGFLSNEHNDKKVSELTNEELEEGIKKLNEYKKQSKQNMDRVINTIMNISGSKPIETGAIYNAMSQISGIKLIWQDKIDGLKDNTGGYLVDLSNYNYNVPILYGLRSKQDKDYTSVSNSELSVFRKEVGARNNKGYSEQQTINIYKRIKKYNDKNRTSHSIKFSRIGQSDLFEIVDIKLSQRPVSQIGRMERKLARLDPDKQPDEIMQLSERIDQLKGGRQLDLFEDTPSDFNTFEDFRDSLEKDCSIGGSTQASEGLVTKFTKGGNWVKVKDFKGKSHGEGGIDIEISNSTIKMNRGDSEFKAKNGLVIAANGLVLPGDNTLEFESMSKVLTERNKHLNWVERGVNPDKYPVIDNGDGTFSTHKLVYSTGDSGKAYVYPTIIQQEDGSLKELSESEAWKYADDTKTYMIVPNVKLADYYSREGLIKHDKSKSKENNE